MRESIDKSAVNFHSLRHWFATKLTENGVMQEQIGYLMGHKGKNLVSTVYSEGATVEQLRGWVEKIPQLSL
ncbi:MAG: tyrosine-type recombinase/integrase [Flavobacteriaceae bacterium]|nr:tyrosine-type recombinase/integrase [Flavobacteriaceae bacterium]